MRAAYAEHDAADPDPEWAPQAVRRVNPGLDEVAERAGAAIVSIDCRRITCAAIVEWPDYAAANSTYQMFLTQRYDLNCMRTVLLEEPVDSSAIYQSRILFDCSDEIPLER